MVVDTIQALATSVEKLLLHAGWGHAIVVVVLATMFISKINVLWIDGINPQHAMDIAMYLYLFQQLWFYWLKGGSYSIFFRR